MQSAAKEKFFSTLCSLYPKDKEITQVNVYEFLLSVCGEKMCYVLGECFPFPKEFEVFLLIKRWNINHTTEVNKLRRSCTKSWFEEEHEKVTRYMHSFLRKKLEKDMSIPHGELQSILREYSSFQPEPESVSSSAPEPESAPPSSISQIPPVPPPAPEPNPVPPVSPSDPDPIQSPPLHEEIILPTNEDWEMIQECCPNVTRDSFMFAFGHCKGDVMEVLKFLKSTKIKKF